MQLSFKRKLALGGAAIAAAAFGGGAYAATQDSASNERQAFINDVAKRLNVSPQQLSAALKGAYSDRIDAAVKAGKLTQAQANELKQRIEQRGGAPFGGGHLFGPHKFGFHAEGGPLSGAAKYLGLTSTQLHDQLEQGKSLTQIAQSRGKSTSGLKDAITSELRSNLDQAVKAKALTSAQQQQILSRQSSQLDQLINSKGEGRPLGFGFHREFHLGSGMPPAGTALPAPPGPPPLPY